MFGYVTALLSPLIALLVAGEVEDFSMVDRIFVGIHSTTPIRLHHGFVLRPSGMSGNMTVTLDLTTIIAMLVASFYRFARLPITCLSSHPILP